MLKVFLNSKIFALFYVQQYKGTFITIFHQVKDVSNTNSTKAPYEIYEWWSSNTEKKIFKISFYISILWASWHIEAQYIQIFQIFLSFLTINC